MEKHITVIKGDGIGPEIVNEAIKVLERIAEKYHHTFHYQEAVRLTPTAPLCLMKCCRLVSTATAYC